MDNLDELLEDVKRKLKTKEIKISDLNRYNMYILSEIHDELKVLSVVHKTDLQVMYMEAFIDLIKKYKK